MEQQCGSSAAEYFFPSVLCRFLPREGPCSPGCRAGGGRRQQQGHRTAGMRLLPSLAGSRWERDWDLIKGTRPGRGGSSGALGCCFLQSCYAGKEKGGRWRISLKRIISLIGLHWSSLEVVYRALKVQLLY